MKYILFTLFFSVLSLTSLSQKGISVQNSVIFGYHEGYGNGPIEEVRFRITVINNSDQEIPNLNLDNRSRLVKFYINQEEANPESLTKGVTLKDDSGELGIGESAIFEHAWLLNDSKGLIDKYGYQFTVMWTYNNIKSKVLHVDLIEKSIIVGPTDEEIQEKEQHEFDYLLTRGNMNFKAKKYKDALMFYERAHEINPEHKYIKEQIELCKKELKK